MNACLLPKTVGDAWQTLPPVIQRHYAVQEGQGSSLVGVMTIAYPHFMLPMIGLISCFGGLVFRRGSNVHTRVEKTADNQGVLHWHRTLRFPDGKTAHFRSQMTYQTEHALIETIRYGFGIRLRAEAEDGRLVYRSQGHCWQGAGLRITLPDWLLLGTATISEQALSADSFRLDFTIRHPWWGETYSYRGDFRYAKTEVENKGVEPLPIA